MKKASIFALQLASALSLVGCGNKAASIGIIGGSDGPTAIFVTSGTNWLKIYSLLGIIAVIILIVLLVRRNKK